MLQALLLAMTLVSGPDSTVQALPDTVWITTQGKSTSYHREPGPGLGIHNQHTRTNAKGETVIMWVTRDEAEASGMKPCGFCFPFRKASSVVSAASKAKAARQAKEAAETAAQAKDGTKK
jgi:hypothetical protein